MKWLFQNVFSLLLTWYCLQFSVFAQGTTIQQQFLSPHNDARAQVGVEALVWNNTVAAYALDYANHRIADCALQHSGGEYGENLFKSLGISDPIGGAVKAWVNESQYYNYSSNSCAEGEVCGHYTQVVWRNTRRLGCAKVKCTDDWNFVICNYDPPGNYVGQRPYEEGK